MGKVKRKKYGIRLHLENDKDILARLEEVDSKAGYIKELIKRDIMRGGRNDNEGVWRDDGFSNKKAR